MHSFIVCVVVLALAGHARGDAVACLFVRAIAAGVPPAKAAKLTGAQVDAVAPPKAADGTFAAGMKDVKAALDVTCGADVMAVLEEAAPLYVQALSHPAAQDLRIGFRTTQYENDPTAQHLMLVVPSNAALVEVGVASPADLDKFAAALPLIIGSTVYDSHALNGKPQGPVDLYPLVKGVSGRQEDPAYPLAALQTKKLAKGDAASPDSVAVTAVLQQSPQTLILGDTAGNSAVRPPLKGFACKQGVSIILVGDTLTPQGFVVGGTAEAASELLGPAPAPRPAPPSPHSTAAPAGRGLGAAALAAVALAALV